MLRRRTQSHYQKGMTLLEQMVALGISTVVITAMVALMGNTLFVTSLDIKKVRLDQEVRSTVQMVTRDIRRASYNAESILCFGNMSCFDGTYTAGGWGSDLSWLDLSINAANDCVIFQMDRNHDGNPGNDAAAGFRRVTSNGVGRVQMWVGSGSETDPTCTTGSSWVDLTNDDVIDVTEFLICDTISASDAQCDDLEAGADDPDLPDTLSFSDEVQRDGSFQWMQQIRIVQVVMRAELVSDSDMSTKIVDRIRVRNDRISKEIIPSATS